jgi:hypothetical protein
MPLPQKPPAYTTPANANQSKPRHTNQSADQKRGKKYFFWDGDGTQSEALRWTYSTLPLLPAKKLQEWTVCSIQSANRVADRVAECSKMQENGEC